MPENTDNPLLQQLRDVHLPPEVSWWPPAPGWWLLALVVITLLTWLVRKLIARHRRNLYRRTAISELSKLHLDWQINNDVKSYLQSASAVMRRAMLHLEGGRHLSSLTGRQWADALHGFCKTGLSEQTINALTVACYHNDPQADVGHVHQQLSVWLKAHKRRPLSPQAKVASTGAPSSEAPVSKAAAHEVKHA